jgi:DNA invertase Pin-like site-specific DNA recombinase
LPKNCAIYAHTANPGGVGINYQIAVCRAYANQQDWSIADHHVFADKGTRDLDRRSGFKALLTAVRNENHPVDIVLVDVGHPLGRTRVERASAVRALRNLGAEVRIAFQELAGPIPDYLGISQAEPRTVHNHVD